MTYYNKLLEIYSDKKYPFNLINNLKDNIVSTKNEIELEYIKDLNSFVDTKQKDFKTGGVEKKIKIYVY